MPLKTVFFAIFLAGIHQLNAGFLEEHMVESGIIALCANEVTHLSSLRKEIWPSGFKGEPISGEALSNVVKRECGKMDRFKSCVTNSMNLAGFFMPESKDQFSFLRKGGFAAVDILCENNGARIVDYMNNGGPQCVKSKQWELFDCADNFVKPSGSDLSEKCSEYMKMGSCMLSKLRECPSQAAGDLSEVTIKGMQTAAGCSKE